MSRAKESSIVNLLKERSNEEVAGGLFANAISSMKHGLSHLGQAQLKSEDDFKFAYLHISHSLELLLKCALAEEHRFLIVRDLEKPSGNTVNWSETLSRLELLKIREFTQSELSKMKTVRDTRNVIEHFVDPGVYDNETLLWLVSLWFAFVKRHLEKYNIREWMSEEEYDVVLSIDQDFQELLKEATKKIVHDIKQLRESSVHFEIQSCHKCGEQMVLVARNKSEATCYYCELMYRVVNCLRCGDTTIVSDEYGTLDFCEACYGKLEREIIG